MVSSRSCFCWLYRASPSLVAKNIISLISVLTIWWCPCVESSVVLLEESVLWPVRSFGKTLLAFALLHLFSKAKLVCYSRYLLVPCFCITVPYDEEGVFFFLILVLEGLVGLHRILFIWGSKRLQWSSMAVLTPEVKDLSVKICPSPFFLSKNIILTTTHSVIRKLS